MSLLMHGVDGVLKNDAYAPINMFSRKLKRQSMGRYIIQGENVEQISHPLKSEEVSQAVTRVHTLPHRVYKMSILRLRLTIISCTESIVFFSRSVSVALV